MFKIISNKKYKALKNFVIEKSKESRELYDKNQELQAENQELNN